MKKNIIPLIICLLCIFTSCKQTKVYELSKLGIQPNTKENISPLLQKVIEQIKEECVNNENIVIRFDSGEYHFYPENSSVREYYISNHDQDNPKLVGIALEGINNLTFDGQGSAFIYHGRMLPVSLLDCKNCTLQNFSVDFENPQITQVQVIENSPEEGITFKVAPWAKYRIDTTGHFEAYGEGWTVQPNMGIAFEEKTKHLVYRTSDIGINTQGVQELEPYLLKAPQWKDSRLIPGTVVAMRNGYRPTPGIFMYHDTNTLIQNIQMHYAEGMGLLAQISENITLNGFSVCLKGDNDPRYFTTQADATHFSGCKGKIISQNNIYEGMMDDAINIHGTYLKVMKRVNDNTLVGRYMQDQAWGFEWGRIGDEVQFLNSSTMEIFEKKNKITSIRPIDKDTDAGARLFEITFAEKVDTSIHEGGRFGIENLEWTPEVLFSNNTIRNNRARGTLFSTPKKTVIENNYFDHTSGSAILLCGDCNGWYETGACRNVIIRKNRFLNSLTNMFQFTDAIISIYPVIPNLKEQKKYFHGGKEGGVVIEDNLFETFDQPIVYAKSLDGFTFVRNTIKQNSDYKAFHQNNKRFFFQRVKNVKIENNQFDGGFNQDSDIRNED